LQKKRKKVEYDENGCAIEDKNDKFPEKSKNRFTATLVQSCVELDGCLIEIVESIKERMDREISNVISRATLIISDKAYFQRNGNQTSNLVDLLELLFKNFKSIAAAHKFLIKCLKKQAKILRNEGCDESEIGQIYTMDDVWSKITANLESLLRRYLEDTSQTSSENFSLGAAAANPASIDFWKSDDTDGGITATKKLFKFDASMHAKSMNEYLRDQRREKTQDGQIQNPFETQEQNSMLCRPSPRNITVIYKPLSDFIEEQSSYDVLTKPLKQFIQDHIEQTFMNQVKTEVKRDLDFAVKVADPLKVLTDGTPHNSSVPLLKSSVVVEQSITELSDLAIQLGAEFRTNLLDMLCQVLQEFHQTIQHHFNQLTKICDFVNEDDNTERDEEVLICMAAVIEKNGVHHTELTSLHNWRDVRGQGSKGHKKQKLKELRKAYREEANILNSILMDIYIAKPGEQTNNLRRLFEDPNVKIGGALDDMSDCNALAHVHESLEWVAMKMGRLLSRLSALDNDESNTIETIASLRNQFQSLSETCLLVLHLDVRVRCYQKLVPMLKNNDYNTDATLYNPYATADKEHTDREAEQLSRQLDELSEKLQNSLQPNKYKYVFSGLGQVISWLMIDAAKFIKNKKVNQTGVKRICRNIFSIQQKLTNITLTREGELDACRQFYEMLYAQPGEFISSVQENGTQHATSEQYLAGFDLLINSSNIDVNKGVMHRNKLIEIMKFEDDRTQADNTVKHRATRDGIDDYYRKID